MTIILTKKPQAGGGGTGGGIDVETDPVAVPRLNTHKTSADHDTHNDARYDAAGTATTAVTTHTGAADPHGDRTYADGRIAALVNAAPAALDTLAEIDAQLASDETGAAAMQAAINQRALITDLTAETNRAEAAETNNANNLTAHLNDPDAAHAASAVSVNPSGLVVVTGTNVQAAVAQLDAWANARPTSESGTLTAMPANGARPNGSTYLATDQYGGTPYQMVAGAWVQEAAGAGQAAGTVAGPVQLAAAFSVLGVGVTWTDVPLMSINVPASSRPVMIRFKCEAVITTGTAAANSSARIWLALATAANVLVELGEFGAYVSGTSYQIAGHIAIEHYLAAPVAAATYKLQARMQAATAGLNTASITPSNGLVGGAVDNLVAVAA